MPDSWPDSFLYMHLCSSAGQPYAEAAILMTYMNYEEVESWAGTSIGHRGEAYEKFKQEKAGRLLDLLEKQAPGTKENIERYYTSSPLTYADYTGTEKGSMYGILHDCTDPVQTMVFPRTKIPNLFQTGQNIKSHGIIGVIIGSILSSGEIIGVNTILKQISKVE
jgi:all-trans-retinol 13,14-reductase